MALMKDSNEKLQKAINDQKIEYQERLQAAEAREKRLEEKLTAVEVKQPLYKKPKSGLDALVDFGAGLLNSFIPGVGGAAKGLLNVFGL